MEGVKVKIFSRHSAEGVENEVNDFLENVQEVIDIKFSVALATDSDSKQPDAKHAVLIIYK
ncbi:MAG: sporulation protein Cse60 [Bacillota bacterium]|nr:sporulation protein Cse60 [Bacillota bacterium]